MESDHSRTVMRVGSRPVNPPGPRAPGYSSALSSFFSNRMICFFTTSTLFVSSKSALTISDFVASSPSAGSNGWMLVTPAESWLQAVRIC